jgi:hypothetical protein
VLCRHGVSEVLEVAQNQRNAVPVGKAVQFFVQHAGDVGPLGHVTGQRDQIVCHFYHRSWSSLESGMVRDPTQPPGNGSGGNRRRLASEREECGLERVLGGVMMTRHGPADPPNEIGVALHEQLESGGFAALSVPTEQYAI